MFLLENSAVWIHAETTACFDFGFDFHVSPPGLQPLSSMRGPEPLLTPVFLFIVLSFPSFRILYEDGKAYGTK